MMAFHELGHVVGALLTGGTVERVVLHPLDDFSHRRFSEPQAVDCCLAWSNSWLCYPCCLLLAGPSTIDSCSQYRLVLCWFLLVGQRFVHRHWFV